MVKGKLYCSQDNFRGQKILVTAKYSGKELELEGMLHNDMNKRHAVYLVVLLRNETSMSIE